MHLQEYDGALKIGVIGATPSHNYVLCGGEIHELHIGCMKFKGTEFVDGYYGEFYYVPHENVKLYGCVIDQTSHKHNCDVVFTESTVGSMSLDVGKESKIPTPVSESSIQLVEVETEEESGVSDEDSDSSDNDDQTQYTDPETGLVYDIPTQGDYCLDFDEDAVCNVDFTNGKMVTYDDETGEKDDVEEENGGSDEDASEGRPPSNNPYCDVVRQTGEPYDVCFDRKDYSDTTGLYPCRDGSDVKDWRDCPDGPEAQAEGEEDNNDNNNESEKEKYDECPAGSANPEEGCELEGYQCGPDGCGNYVHGICEDCNEEESEVNNDDEEEESESDEEDGGDVDEDTEGGGGNDIPSVPLGYLTDH